MPWERSGWQHRFDDPRRDYRTLYCAERPLTCLLEVLQDLRPSTKMLADMEDTVGVPADLRRAAGAVTRRLREVRVLARGELRWDGEIVSIDQPKVRTRLEREFAGLLAEHGVKRLNVSEIRSRTRIVTQTIARRLYERGGAGVLFGSNVDDRPCLALFEGRAELVPTGEVIDLLEDDSLLRDACDELGLRVA